VLVLPVDGAVNIGRGGWLASDDGIEIDSKWGGLKNLAGGEGGFLVRATGRGTVVIAAYGAIDLVELGENDSFVLDSGHMVAYDDGLRVSLRKVAKGLVQTLKSGEGFVFEFGGPGRVWTQSRNPSEFVGWLSAELPGRRG
jgi:uncharacterized protein (TIGR00266 family)